MSATREARVIVSYGSHGVVQVANEAPVPCLFRRRVGRPFCGDRVEIAPTADGAWVVEAVQPRVNQFMRADGKGRPQTIAANLDRVVITIAHRPLPSRDLLDRYLVAVHSLDLEPVIVVNKVELEPDWTEAGAATLKRLSTYRDLGYEVATTSCKGSPGVEALAPLVTGNTSILVGQSGVGKSSLITRLVPDREIQTGALSRVTGKGTHTTTTTISYDLPGGGRLIDSPGVWEYGLWRLEQAAIAAGFREFSAFSAACRFNDCRHDQEPGCAVKAAVADGLIKDWRHASYLRLLAQNATQPVP
ncbi:MAG: ribosome small subunit-dependent GTPase A [Pseudomonadota bacterium]